MEAADVARVLRQHHFRMTRERRALLDLFIEADTLLTPAQLHAFAQARDVDVGLTTVYRLLEVLTKAGLASPFLLEGSIYYTFCTDHHHHHFICLNCRHVENIYGCSATVEPPPGCTVSYHRVDLFGRCARCRSDVNVTTP
ncbi:MAG: transcriptional repressor [Thermoflavifilum sp.]|nr:transcriptional repressor [Thermoflavifilum sp.]MCL6513073.1 transcriptional repressor [Alicyclobacillus sp.]